MLAKERKELYNVVFNTPEGNQVLADLCKKYYVHSTTFSKENNEYQMAYKEGQRRVMLYILNLLEDKA